LDDVKIDAAVIGSLVEDIRGGRFGEIHSMLIYKDDLFVLEEYFPGHDYQWDGRNHHGEWVDWDKDHEHNIHSVGKSITSACIGIAIEKGFIDSVDQSIFDYLPDHQHLRTNSKDQITIEHLLTMTSGLVWDEWSVPYSNPENDISRLWVECDDQVSCILEAPLVGTPGSEFTYSGGGMVLLGEIIKNASGMDIEAFSGEYLFEPLGIDPPEWVRFDSGAIYAGGDQRLTPRGMMKIGITFLNGGGWKRQPIVSKEWVEKSAEPYRGPKNTWFNSYLRPIPPGDGTLGSRGYSYTWWTHQFSQSGRNVPVYWAGGWGSQGIIILPEERTVAVFTGGNYTSADPIIKILKKYVIPSLK
jgi:CubicO group peptidase (beta-lactamase class C family)